MPNTHFTLIDGVILILYFVATFAVAFIVHRRSKSVSGYTAAGGNLPGWLPGLSILATYISSISFLALPGKAFADNWNPFVFSLALPIATWIAVKWFLPFYRNAGCISAYRHLEERFGPWASVYASICYLLTQIARMGAVMYLMALPMQVLLGWDIKTVIIITGMTTTIYTFTGGILAVIWTDALQTVVLVIGALLCLFLLVFGLPEGPGQLFTIAAEHDKFSLGSFGLDLSQSTFWVVLIYGVFINLQNFGIDQNYVQRYLTSRDDREARKSVWLGGLLYLPLSAVFFFIGTALFAFYTAQPGLLPAEYSAPGKSDSVFPYFIVAQLPPGVTGLLIAAVFAAAMSTISSSLNSGATIILTDFYSRFCRPDATDREQMRILYIFTVLLGIVGTLAALAMINNKSALDTWWSLAGIFSGGMLGLFLLGLLSRQVGNRAAIGGVAVGVLVIVWMANLQWVLDIFPRMRSPFHSFLTVVFGTLAIMLVGLFLSLFLPRRLAPGSTQAAGH